MKSRRTLQMYSNARMMSGRPALRSSAALHRWQMSRITEFEELLSSLEDQLPDELLHTVFSYITSPDNVLRFQRMSVTQWYEDVELFLNTEVALQMYSRGCYALH